MYLYLLREKAVAPVNLCLHLSESIATLLKPQLNPNMQSLSNHNSSFAYRDPAAFQRRFFAHLLIFVAVWSLFIKYLFPITFAVVYDEPALHYVYWDFWPLVHLWLAWSLLTLPSYVKWLAWCIALVEVIIILVKFYLFLTDPQWDIWRTNWFINKVFVLLTFLLLSGSLLLQPDMLSKTREGTPNE